VKKEGDRTWPMKKWGKKKKPIGSSQKDVCRGKKYVSSPRAEKKKKWGGPQRKEKDTNQPKGGDPQTKLPSSLRKKKSLTQQEKGKMKKKERGDHFSKISCRERSSSDPERRGGLRETKKSKSSATYYERKMGRVFFLRKGFFSPHQ